MYSYCSRYLPTDLYLVRLHCLSLMSALLTPSMRACMPSMHTDCFLSATAAPCWSSWPAAALRVRYRSYRIAPSLPPI